MTQVLILEDDLKLLHLFSRSLEKAGYEVTRATTIAEATSILSRQMFTVFVCDVHLPDGDSLDLLATQKAIFAQQRTHVIVISAEERYLEWCYEHGYNLFQTKPIMPGALVGLVRRVTSYAEPMN